jgi:hypothetical protein
METESKIEAMMKLISGLIAKAESTDSEHEAAALRAKAEELMRKYRIEEENLIAADPGTLTPTHKTFDVVESGHEFIDEIYQLWYDIAAHCGVRHHVQYEYRSGRPSAYVTTAVGYASDLRYAELLFVSARLVFASKLTPEVNPQESDRANVYRLRSAGRTRRSIALLMWGEDTHAAHAKVGKLYAEACAERGEDPVVAGRTINAKTYRSVFARSFTSAFRYRLFKARQSASATGGGLELAGREERVNEAFYAMYPAQRPQPKTEEKATDSKPGKAVKEWKPTKADIARHNRLNNSETAQAARRAGIDAAADVRLARTAGTEELSNN